MEIMVFAARVGNRILSAAAAVLMVLMMSYGGYSLWDNFMVSRGALLDGEILKYKPETGTSRANPSLRELAYLNPDVRAWLTIDGTRIDYPVVQGEDDMEYVNKDVLGGFSLSGSIFLSCLNSPDFSDGYSLIYGHHMDNGGMFSDVMEFLDEDYFQAHEAGTLSLAGESFDIRLFACAEVDAYDELVYSPGPEVKTGELLEFLEKNSVSYRDIEITPEDRIVGLSTCVDALTNGRAVLFGRLEKK